MLKEKKLTKVCHCGWCIEKISVGYAGILRRLDKIETIYKSYNEILLYAIACAMF